MPERCRFHGLVIAMYHNEHGAPHFHVIYAEHEVTIEIETEHIHGWLPRRIHALALEWSRQHRAELLDNWCRGRRGEALYRIRPLE